MIIFGFRSFVKQLAILTLVCGHCHRPAAHRVLQITRMFTLFFIPVFPISRRRHMTCTFCGAGTRLSNEQVDQLMAGANGPADGPAAEQIAAPPTTPPAAQWTPPTAPPPPAGPTA